MYGWVDRADQDLVCSLKGEAGWQRVRDRAGLSDEDFLDMKTFPDELTYQLGRVA